MISFRVPPEITELIIDEVSLLRDGRDPSLKACALTCKAFSKLSQRRLFHTVHLYHDSSESGKYVHFLSALLSSPELAHSVRELYIHDNGFQDFMISHPAFPEVLALFQNLTMFSLLCEGYAYFNWEAFTPGLKRALTVLFLLPTISELSLRHIYHLPPTLAKWFTYIPTLALRDVSFSRIQEDSSTQHTTRDMCNSGLYALSIEYYEIENPGSFYDYISAPECKLETLILKAYSPCNIAIAKGIIRRSRASLTTLECMCLSPEIEDPVELDIGIASHLRIVKILANFEEDDPLDPVQRILSQAREENEIREIVILLFFTVFSDIINSNSQGCWDRLDALLATSQFAQLQRVNFTFSPDTIKHFEDGSVDAITSGAIHSVTLLLRSFLPGVNEKGLLHFYI